MMLHLQYAVWIIPNVVPVVVQRALCLTADCSEPHDKLR